MDGVTQRAKRRVESELTTNDLIVKLFEHNTLWYQASCGRFSYLFGFVNHDKKFKDSNIKLVDKSIDFLTFMLSQLYSNVHFGTNGIAITKYVDIMWQVDSKVWDISEIRMHLLSP